MLGPPAVAGPISVISPRTTCAIGGRCRGASVAEFLLDTDARDIMIAAHADALGVTLVCGNQERGDRRAKDCLLVVLVWSAPSHAARGATEISARLDVPNWYSRLVDRHVRELDQGAIRSRARSAFGSCDEGGINEEFVSKLTITARAFLHA
jgi:hypothetical protein